MLCFDWLITSIFCSYPSSLYVENIKSTNFILAQTQNPQIYESMNQTMKIDTHEEKYFHSRC